MNLEPPRVQTLFVELIRVSSSTSEAPRSHRDTSSPVPGRHDPPPLQVPADQIPLGYTLWTPSSSASHPVSRPRAPSSGGPYSPHTTVPQKRRNDDTIYADPGAGPSKRRATMTSQTPSPVDMRPHTSASMYRGNPTHVQAPRIVSNGRAQGVARPHYEHSSPPMRAMSPDSARNGAIHPSVSSGGSGAYRMGSPPMQSLLDDQPPLSRPRGPSNASQRRYSDVSTKSYNTTRG